MRYDEAFFDQGIDRRGTNCEKWDDPSMCPPGAMPFWVADMDFRCDEGLVSALKKRAEHACYGYSMEDAEGGAAFRAFWARRHRLEIAKDEHIMLPCVITGLRAAVRAFTREGEGVIVTSPVYGPFYSVVKDNNRALLEAPLKRDAQGRYSMDLDRIETHLRAGARLMLLCNPHNPVSRLWSAEELKALCDLLARYGARLCADEIHADFVYAPGVFTPILSVPGAKERTVSLASASKTFNIAGLQQAEAVCMEKKMLEVFTRELRAAGATCGNTFALAATRAAYEGGDDWLNGLLAYLDGNRKTLAALLSEYLPKAKLTPIEATYLAWVDVSAYGVTGAQAAAQAKNEGAVFTVGTFFGDETGRDFIRFNFGCPRSRLKEGVIRLARALCV